MTTSSSALALPDVLHPEVVLVGEEVGHLLVVLVRTGEVVGGDLGLLDRGVPVLDPDPPARAGGGRGSRCPRRPSTDGTDVRRPASTSTPFPTSSPPVRASSTRGCTPMPATTRSAPSRSAGVTSAPRRRSTPCSRCRSAKTAATVEPEHPQQRQLLHLEDGDVGAGGAGGRRDLEPDPAGADDDDLLALAERLLEPVAVLDGAQVGDRHAGLLGHSQDARLGARRQEELLVGEVAGGRRQGVGVGVEAGGRDPEAQVHVVLGVPLRGVHQGLLEGVLAEEVGLRERWALVRRVLLGPDEHHLPLVPLLPQLGGGGGSCEPCSDDDDRHGTDATPRRGRGGSRVPRCPRSSNRSRQARRRVYLT